MLNIASNLYKAEWIELVFKNRNKNYGAYSLRAESSANTLRAFFFTAPVFILLFAGPMLYKRLYPDVIAKAPAETRVVDVAALPPVDKKIIHEQKKEIHKATANPVPLKLKTVKMTSHISVVDHPDVDETPPSLDELNHAVIGQAAQPGAAANQDAVQSVAGKGENGAGTAVPDNNIYDAAGVDSYPEFEGGMAAWAKFLQHNLKYPGAAQEEGIQGKVFVSFVIETDGSVSNVTIIKGIGAGCDEEALRVIKKSPKWKPGQQQNKSVRVRYTIPLAFTLN